MLKVKVTKRNTVAASASFFWWKRIYVSALFCKLSSVEQQAVIAHELYHCENHHSEWRALALMFPAWMKRMCHRQEFEADLFAAKLGYGHALIKVLSRFGKGGDMHPATAERIKVIEQFTLRTKSREAGASESLSGVT